MALEIGSDFAGYRVEQLLGVGGMGQVYLVEHRHLGRREAMKTIPDIIAGDEFVERFTTELGNVAALDHPSIVDIHDYGIEDEIPWFTMDYLKGENLTNARLSRSEISSIIGRVAHGLDYAHSRGVVHRDIKPANIMITRTAAGRIDDVVMLDFGIATLREFSALTATTTFLGTLFYAAPEALRGDEVDGRTDQYALACTAFQLLTGQPPFGADTRDAVIEAHLSAPRPRASGLDPTLTLVDDILARGMAIDPADRYPDCAAFSAALARPLVALTPHLTAAAAPAEPMEGTPPPIPTPPGFDESAATPPDPRRRRKVALLSLAALAVVAVIVGIGTWAMNWIADDVAVDRVKGSDQLENPSGVADGSWSQVTLAIDTSAGCALADGKVYCFTFDDVLRPVDGLPDNVSQISGATTDVGHDRYGTACAVADGQVYCWGAMLGGPRFTGSDGPESYPQPTAIPGLDAVSQVSVGTDHACAIQREEVLCWGDGAWGALGVPSVDPADYPTSAEPVAVEGLPGPATEISAGSAATCAVVAGDAWCWGRNDVGQVGAGVGESIAPAQRVDGLGTVTAVATASDRSCAVSDGDAYCWGRAGSDRGADMRRADRPVRIDGVGDLDAVAVGGGFCGISSGQLFCWNNIPVDDLVAGVEKVGGLDDVSSVDVGIVTLAVVADGDVYEWLRQ